MVSISILTPSFNYAQFLRTALNSTLSSGYPVEHVVMDAESSDSTLEVLAEHGSAVTWRSEPDSGQSDALNKALKISTGDVVGWLNADDFYLPAALPMVARAFEEDPGLDVLYGDTVMVDGEGKVLRLLKAYPTPRKVLEWRGPVFLSTAAFYRRAALGDDPFDVRMKMLMDWDIFLKLAQNDSLKSVYLPLPLAAFRLHGLQVTHDQTGYRSPEHSLLRQKHGINERVVPLTRFLGVALHRANKLVRGSWLRECQFRRLRGERLITRRGEVNARKAMTLMQASGVDPMNYLAKDGSK